MAAGLSTTKKKCITMFVVEGLVSSSKEDIAAEIIFQVCVRGHRNRAYAAAADKNMSDYVERWNTIKICPTSIKERSNR
ncbi:hypothetical protein AMTR_s00246p00018760 [Amborella trichopoda]|uniref:Uncharacterized protein n=1 Tax=Amborella trichopoda TaxID=13333 RepID=W1NPC6_AMBTC|nr:hypothetical protein AMTR_s00246p00018760 [Amborella trichopoda]